MRASTRAWPASRVPGYLPWKPRGRKCYSDVAFQAGDAFLFGPETRGLPHAVLARVGSTRTLFIPMRAESRSINLSNAVALVAYEAWRQLAFAGSG